MPTSKTCSFCGNKITPGKGLMIVKKDGTVLYFCSSKCEKNMLELGRKPENVEWTKKSE
ncbi:50S ribosomal protein L24 [candidate division MSBL1 archaeon SCGC-AAA382A03]|uniref:Large ribosomal subunit protein eL24 n=1 Tax=candidate division MSBL1 archaeon SCGC-AAA382A03 TaxID=1698278 RepID=A0A133VEW0_9EURY|nr:50S ribosomal protein L24 [candidate division MSBL1 archaeon SCGC-AAA382A03]